MGCNCIKPNSDNNEIAKEDKGGKTSDKLGVQNNSENNLNQEGSGEQELNLNEYQSEVFELINQIRTDPPSFINIIENSKQFITEIPDKANSNKTKLIFKKKVKVALNRGEQAFIEASEQLSQTNPMQSLIFKPEICVPIPESEEEIKNPNYLKQQIQEIKQHDNVDVYFKDLVKIPEVSGLLMVVDDSGKNAGKKRMALLNEDFKYIGISSGTVGKSFVAYFTFSK